VTSAREPAAVHDVSCDHCGLPVPRGLVREDAERQFCCHGCEVVWDVIHAHGFERYYRIRSGQVSEDQAARVSGRGYREFDDPAFRELYVRPSGDGTLSTELYLEGVHCAACVWLVEKTPLAIPGVAEIRLDLQRSMARVTWDPATTTLSAIARFLDSLGYAVHPFRGVRLRDMRRREDRDLLIRIGVAGFSAANVMLMSFALYGGAFHGMDPAFAVLFRWGSLAVALPAVLWSAALFYRGAFASLRVRALHMDVPVTLGILAGTAWGAWNVVVGGELYFDSVTALILFLLAGRWVQRRQQRKAADASELLHSLTPSSARLIDGETVREVLIEALSPGMRVEVRAGDSVPVDGTVVEGASDLDRALLTGESRAVPVAVGDSVHAGTTNLTSRLAVEVRGTGEDTRVGRLMHLVEEAARRRAPVVLAADRLSAWFVAVVLILAAATAILWAFLDPTLAVDHAIALLVVTCPCALGLATPLAVSAAIGRAGRAGILIKGGDVLERLSIPGTLVLDKTGTLTSGLAAVVAWIGEDEARGLAAALERHSAHPVARAIVEAFEAFAPEASVRLTATQGGGVRGSVGGREVAVGSPSWVDREVARLPAWAHREVDRLTADARTPVAVAVDGKVAAVAGLGDRVRDDACATVASLRARGWRVVVESGDHPEVVRAVAAEVGIEPAAAHGARSPEDKLATVRALSRDRAVVMVGDGVNDAAALSAASVGIAVEGGAEAAMIAADVFLSRPGLAQIAELFDGARRTMRVIRWNLALSLGYNVVGAALAMAGLISPLVAAILMPASSLTVIMLSYRAKTFPGATSP
jgi:Cu2+-exporting ATPase